MVTNSHNNQALIPPKEIFLLNTDTNSNDILCNNNSDTVSNVKIDDTETKLYGKTSKKSTSNNIIKNRRIGSDKSGFKSIVHKVMSWNNRISNSHKDKTNITVTAALSSYLS